MPRFLFWNYRCEHPEKEEILARLVHHEAVDVVILAESSCEPRRLVDHLSSAGRIYHPMPFAHERLQVFAGYSAETFRWSSGVYDRLCLLGLQFPGQPEMILGAVHLASGLHLERSERYSKAAPLARAVRQIQIEHNHARTIIVGDFNMNPFDDGMIFTEGFGAMMTKSLVKKSALARNGRFTRFYNPIWTRLGREINEGAPGTYYWDQHRDSNIYWNYVDQVLVGHDLLDSFPDSRFRILTSIPGSDGPRQLIRSTKHHWAVEVSDHLPLIFDVDLPAEAEHE
jgi:endonuclease/exonuclease/phosphatase family metal-dependent hydrolase